MRSPKREHRSPESQEREKHIFLLCRFNALWKDSGLYRCIAENEVGRTEKDVTVHVLGNDILFYFHLTCLCSYLITNYKVFKFEIKIGLISKVEIMRKKH